MDTGMGMEEERDLERKCANDPSPNTNYHLEKWVEVKKILQCPEGFGLRNYALLTREILNSVRACVFARDAFKEDPVAQRRAVDDIMNKLYEMNRAIAERFCDTVNFFEPEKP